MSEEEQRAFQSERERVTQQLRAGQLEQVLVEIEVEERPPASDAMFALGFDTNLGDMLGGILPKKMKRRKLPVSEARRVLVQQESEKRIDMDDVTRDALQRAEQDGIIFIDEIDKIAGGRSMGGPDVSREGVQRDILPIVEGSTVATKYGPVKTDFILFIAAGAFHTAKVTETIDNENTTGAVYIDGKTWTARSEDGDVIARGSMVTIVRMEGVKLFVRKEREEP